ncbi:glycosyltransferase [Kitasatospora sp. NPDC048540]|uniref:glycosyltransferase n=1 Tax=unclassified Kitasatospora TaxID=2633591 RepID=UPI00053AA4D3|nr:glycosyltransferase [Kitasatospora sp. MBT63]
MRFLLSTIGSRGDVQPMAALASELSGTGHQVRVCAPPDFGEWIEGLGIPFVPIGPELRTAAASGPRPAAARPTPEQLRRLARSTVDAQFATLPAAADGCEVIVAGGALQIAARSVAEQLGIGYVYAGYCPTTLPSPHHAPPPLTALGQRPAPAAADHLGLWAENAAHLNDTFGAALAEHRAAVGLAPVDDVRSHLFTDRPWLAADPVLGPWPGSPGGPEVVQTGAWLLTDERPLPAEVTAFLEGGEPPLYFGFGSMRAPQDLAATMLGAARALGRRAIVSRGWAGLAPADGGADCLSIGEINQQLLFPRVAAVVHHGGAGTTTAAARAGAPQVVLPQMYDQYYWAGRVGELGIGTPHPKGAPTVDSLTAALGRVLRPGVAARARAVAATVRTDGAATAARRLTERTAV